MAHAQWSQFHLEQQYLIGTKERSGIKMNNDNDVLTSKSAIFYDGINCTWFPIKTGTNKNGINNKHWEQ